MKNFLYGIICLFYFQENNLENKIEYFFSKSVEEKIFSVVKNNSCDYYCVLYSNNNFNYITINYIKNERKSIMHFVNNTSRFINIKGKLIPIISDYDFRFGVIRSVNNRIDRVVPIQEKSITIYIDNRGNIIDK